MTRKNVTQDAVIPQATAVDDGVTVGEETKIWHFCHLMLGLSIGANCRIGQNVVLGPDVSIRQWMQNPE